jgi:hypothetical protein
MLGLDTDVNFEEMLNYAFESYVELLNCIYDGNEIDAAKLSYFKECVMDMLVLHGLTESELNRRELYVGKFNSLLDVIRALQQIAMERNQK